MDLSQVFYISRARANPAQVERIVAEARSANGKRHLTGAMVFTGSHFAQALEGPGAEVDALVAKISIDPRHERFTIVLDRPVDARFFKGWTMAFEHQWGADSLIARILDGAPPDSARVDALFENLFRTALRSD